MLKYIATLVVALAATLTLATVEARPSAQSYVHKCRAEITTQQGLGSVVRKCVDPCMTSALCQVQIWGGQPGLTANHDSCRCKVGQAGYGPSVACCDLWYIYNAGLGSVQPYGNCGTTGCDPGSKCDKKIIRSFFVGELLYEVWGAYCG